MSAVSLSVVGGSTRWIDKVRPQANVLKPGRRYNFYMNKNYILLSLEPCNDFFGSGEEGLGEFLPLLFHLHGPRGHVVDSFESERDDGEGRLGRHTRRRRQRHGQRRVGIGRRFSDEMLVGEEGRHLPLEELRTVVHLDTEPLHLANHERGKLFQQTGAQNLFGFGCELDKVVSAVQSLSLVFLVRSAGEQIRAVALVLGFGLRSQFLLDLAIFVQAGLGHSNIPGELVVVV